MNSYLLSDRGELVILKQDWMLFREIETYSWLYEGLRKPEGLRETALLLMEKKERGVLCALFPSTKGQIYSTVGIPVFLSFEELGGPPERYLPRLLRCYRIINFYRVDINRYSRAMKPELLYGG